MSLVQILFSYDYSISVIKWYRIDRYCIESSNSVTVLCYTWNWMVYASCLPDEFPPLLFIYLPHLNHYIGTGQPVAALDGLNTEHKVRKLQLALFNHSVLGVTLLNVDLPSESRHTCTPPPTNTMLSWSDTCEIELTPMYHGRLGIAWTCFKWG